MHKHSTEGRFLVLVSIILFTIVTANAQDWEGFKKVEGSTDVPHAEIAMKHVFKLRSFNSRNVSRYDIVDVEKQKKISNKKTLNTNHRAIQIETCRRYSIRRCPVGSRISTSTIVMDGGSKFHVCRHSFHEWIAMVTKVNSIPILDVHLPMIILNYKNEVIYNSAYSPAESQINFINLADRLNFHYEDEIIKDKRPQFFLFTTVTDYMNVKFSKPIADLPALSMASPSIGRVYNYGYPGKTKFYGGVKNGDTPGEILVATSGDLTEYSATRKQLIATSTAGSGMSGGAMLNSQGSLMGVVCNGDKDDSLGIYPNESELTEFWKKLEGLSLD